MARRLRRITSQIACSSGPFGARGFGQEALALGRDHVPCEVGFGHIESFGCALSCLDNSCEVVEHLALAGKDLGDSQINALLGKQAMDLDGFQLTQPSGARDGLPFCGWFELGLADHDDRGGLDVQAYATCHNL